MKLQHSKYFSWILAAALVAALASCKKQNPAGFTSGTGAPQISHVTTLSKTLYDTLVTQIITYDTLGNPTTTVDSNKNNQTLEPFDSTTDAGNLGQYYVIHGSNLGSATTVEFNGISVFFNRGLMTDQTIVVLIPTTIPTAGPQATDTLTVITLHGTVKYHFIVLSPPPTITTASDYDFWSGSQITLKGVGFAAVTSVGLTGTTATPSIVSQSDSVLTLQFPQTSISRGNLIFNYNVVSSPVTIKSTQEFVDLDNAYNVFFKSSFQNGWYDNSWTAPSGVQSGPVHGYGGTASLKGTYPAGAWQIEGWATGTGVSSAPSYKYLTFWVLGGVAQHTLTLVGDQAPGGYSQLQVTVAPAAQLVVVPPGVWTYFKIPLGAGSNQLNWWANGNTSTQLGFFLQGMSGDVNETLYFDEVGFTK